MNKHEEAREDLIRISGVRVMKYNQKLLSYITSCESTEKAYEELKRDVKRYFELNECSEYYLTPEEKNEKRLLETKLLKVGNE